VPHSPEIGFVGLGNMGGPMSTRLVAAGYPVAGFDLADSARADLASSGGRSVDAVGDLAEADIVILMLPNSDVVESVAAQLATLMRPGTTIVDMSSSEPTRTRRLAERLAGHDLTLIDAPVSGGVRGAVDGTLTIMVGGPYTDVPGLEELFARLGRVIAVGPVGSGHAVKSLNNLLSAAHFWLTSEAIAIGIQLGVDPEVLLSVINTSSGRSGSSEAKWPNFVLPATYDSGFEAQLMLKDLRIAVGLADDVALPSVLGRDLVALWQAALEGLPPHADHTEIAKVLLARTSGSPASVATTP